MQRLVRLPTLRPVHAQALVLVGTSEFNVDRYCAVVSVDPALTIAVLRAANSAASSPASTVSSTRNALVRLGAREARRIVTSVVLASHLSSGLGRSGLDIPALWRHSVTCAVVTEMLSSDDAGGPAFVAGLVHDIGRVAMASTEPHRYRQVVALVHGGLHPLEAEERVFHHTHAALGAEVTEAWGLPESIAVAVCEHHNPARDADPLTVATYRARRIAHALGVTDGLRSLEAMSSEDGEAPSPRGPALDASTVMARVNALCSAISGPL